MFLLSHKWFNETQLIWFGLNYVQKLLLMKNQNYEYFGENLFDALQCIGACAPIYLSLGSIRLELVYSRNMFFCFIFIQALPLNSFPESWKPRRKTTYLQKNSAWRLALSIHYQSLLLLQAALCRWRKVNRGEIARLPLVISEKWVAWSGPVSLRTCKSTTLAARTMTMERWRDRETKKQNDTDTNRKHCKNLCSNESNRGRVEKCFTVVPVAPPKLNLEDTLPR